MGLWTKIIHVMTPTIRTIAIDINDTQRTNINNTIVIILGGTCRHKTCAVQRCRGLHAGLLTSVPRAWGPVGHR